MSKQTNEKICVVCGDRSLGFNFNVLSCESCKAFFRRNALSSKKFTCPFSNECEITIITRRFCQKCRLDKCFEKGMKKEYIMSEEDKELKRIKIEQNRNKRKLKVDTSDDNDNNKFEENALKKVKEENSPYMLSIHSSDDSNDQSISNSNFTINLTSKSNPGDIVRAMSDNPKEAGNIIQEVMKTQEEALSVMSRIITEPNQALLLISHLIKYPENGMMIISKMMSTSPLDALSVFTKFMSSPLNAINIIYKVISCPTDVLKFITELSKSPQNAMEIMNHFTGSAFDSKTFTSSQNHETIRSMLDVSSSLDSPKSMSSMSSPSTNYSSYHNEPFNSNNQHDQFTTTILREIAFDISAKRSSATSFSKVNSIDSIINEAIKLEYNTPETISQLQNPRRELNEIEAMKIEELLDANCALYAPIEDDHLTFLGLGEDGLRSEAINKLVDPILLKVINLTAVAIRRLIKMSKKISGFKKMCQEDQIALLKGGCTEMMILRSVMQYDSDNALWKIPSMNMANLKADILKLCPKGNIYEEHENFIKTFDVRLRTDERVVLILCAITLFCPDRANIIHKDVIKLEQNSYYFLLRRYLESIYEGCEARSIFLQLLKKIQEVRRLNEEVISVYLDANPSQVEPLLREIFDLKP